MAKTKEEIVLTAIRAWKEKDKSNEFWFKAIVEGAYNSGYTKAKQEAADAVEELQTYADLYKDMTEESQRVARKVIDSYPKWIPCSERLPEKGMRVLCACRANIFCVLKWDGIDWVENPTHVYMSGFVTHWMPLPEPPEKESENDD